MTIIKIESRDHEMAGMPLRRILPQRRCRAVGPFVFLDHFGPTSAPMQVAPHPHIGLSTLTWLFSGSIHHADSLGNKEKIVPGEVNWMTAGHGIVHSERSSESDPAPLHGLQCWVAQTTEHEQGEPDFQHLSADKLPRFEQDGVDWTLVVGRWLEAESPLSTPWPTLFVEGHARQNDEWAWPVTEQWAIAVYVVAGTVRVGSESATTGELLVLLPEDRQQGSLCLAADADSHFVLLGGQPLPEARYFDWNFVASDQSLLAEARQRWMDRAFPAVPGDDDRIPHPAE